MALLTNRCSFVPAVFQGRCACWTLHLPRILTSCSSHYLNRASKCEDISERVNPNSVQPGQEADVLCETDESMVVRTDLLVAADGTARTIANRMEEDDQARIAAMNPVGRLFASQPFKVKRYEDDNQRIYKTIPMKIPKDWRFDLNYSARSAGGRVNYDALPANRDGDYCGVLLLKGDDPFAKPDCDPKEYRAFLEEYIPQFSALIDDETVATTAKKPPSFLPSFRYVGPRLHQGERTVLLGDSAHTVKPYFGLGANSALEDVKVRCVVIVPLFLGLIDRSIEQSRLCLLTANEITFLCFISFSLCVYPLFCTIRLSFIPT